MSAELTRALFDVGLATRSDSAALVEVLLDRWEMVDADCRQKFLTHALSRESMRVHQEAVVMLAEVDSMVTAIESCDAPFQDRLGRQLVESMAEFTQTLKKILENNVP